MKELNRDDIYYLNAVYHLVEYGDIPLYEYKKLLGKYSKKAEQEAEKMKRKEYEDRLKTISHWKENRLKDVHEAEELLLKAKDALARTEEDIKEALAPFRGK